MFGEPVAASIVAKLIPTESSALKQWRLYPLVTDRFSYSAWRVAFNVTSL